MAKLLFFAFCFFSVPRSLLLIFDELESIVFSLDGRPLDRSRPGLEFFCLGLLLRGRVSKMKPVIVGFNASLFSLSEDGAKRRPNRSSEARQVGINEEKEDERTEKEEYPIKPYIHFNPLRDLPSHISAME